MNYDNAATIGLRQYVPGWSGSYLDILNQDTRQRPLEQPPVRLRIHQIAPLALTPSALPG